jgi:hypothetical protein
MRPSDSPQKYSQNSPTRRVHGCERFLCQNATVRPPGRPVPVCGSFSRYLERQIGLSCTAPLAVLGIWDRRGQIGFVSVGSEAAKAVPFRGIKGLVKEEGRVKLERELAISLGNRGNALGDLGELTRSFEDYNRAAEIMKRLIEEEGQTDLVDVLAMLRRSRRGDS